MKTANEEPTTEPPQTAEARDTVEDRLDLERLIALMLETEVRTPEEEAGYGHGV